MPNSDSRRSRLLPLAVVLASLAAMVSVPLAAAPAGALNDPTADLWSASGPGLVSVLGNGQNGDPSFNYYYCSSGGPSNNCLDGGVPSQKWTFAATAQSAESVSATYLWSGFHAYFEVTTALTAFVTSGGTTTTTPVEAAAPVDCCTTPSGGFDYTGTYTFSGLANGDSYGFYLYGSNADSNSQLTGTFTFETKGGPPPAAPTNLVASPGFREVGLSWTEPSTTGYGPPTGYDVLVGTSPGTEVPDPYATVTGTTATVTAAADGSTLIGGNTYYFTVAAVNGYGTSAPSSEVSATPAGFQPNTSWFTAQGVNLSPAGSTGLSGTTSQSIDLAGETLWYQFPVQPDAQLQVCLGNVPADYNIALFSDISQTFNAESSSTLNLATLGAEAPGNAVSPSAFSPSAFSPSAFSPSAFSPSAFSPSAFSPSAFSPSAFSPSAFSPSAFSPSAFSPSAFSPSAFSAAYSAAQIDSLLAVSTAPGAVGKCVNADTWNNTGNFYVRISGNNGAFAPLQPYTLTVTSSGSPCSATLSDNPGKLLPADLYDTTTAGGTISGGGPSGRPYQTVIVDDSQTMPAVGLSYSASSPALYTPLQVLANNTTGVVVDVGQSKWVNALVGQAQGNAACPYAENLVAAAIQNIINTYRTSSLKYVVIVGDDDVIPFFRYPDNAGLAPESDYQPPLASTSAADAALQSPDYLSDDQYGAATELTLQGTTVPLPTAAVGRLVETPTDIYNTVESYLGGKTAIGPTSSFVSGYDFMQPPASAIATAFGAGVGAAPTQLITTDGVSPTTTGEPPGPLRSWSATDLATELFAGHHDLVFLGGHFSANNLLAADDTTTLTTNQFASQVGTTLNNSLVISAGCHSGYGIDGADAVPGVTDTLAWPQAFTEAGATLIAGTGYQYGDTNYVAYSDQIYVDLAQQLGYQPAGGPGPVPVGTALLDTKLNYLAGIDQLNGVEEKALLEITLYGLPMLGVKEPGQVLAPGGSATSVTAATVGSDPGHTLGLEQADLNVDPVLNPSSPTQSSSSVTLAGTTYTYDSGPQGVVADPGGPVLPLQLNDVNVSSETLRGVGFWGGSYTDSTGTNPLTGDPATETGNPSVVPFGSPVFFPQTLWNPNYFPTFVNSGDTELALTPEQYESDPGGVATDTRRAYGNLDLHLFYSNNTQSYPTSSSDGTITGNNIPALAAPPTISDVTSTVAGDQVSLSATVTGDPSAGVQEVWVTYTGEASGSPLYGSWTSVDLTQSKTNTTQWTGTFTDASGANQGNPASDARFIVQAVNGVGEVSMNDNGGYYFTPTVTPGAALPSSANSYSLALGGDISGPYEGTASVTATLTSTGGANPIIADQQITFGLGATTVAATTDSSGVARASIPLIQSPNGYTLSASYAGDANDRPATASTSFQITPAPTNLALTAPSGLTAGAGGATATLTGGPNGAALPQKPVYFVVTGPSGTVLTTSGITNAAGVAQSGPLDVPPGDIGSGYSITAYFGSNVPLPGRSSYGAADPDFGPSQNTQSGVSVTDPPPTLTITAPSSVTATGVTTPVNYQVTDVNYDGSAGTPTCSPASGSPFAVGSTTITCWPSYAPNDTATATVDVVPATLTVSVSGDQIYGGKPSWTFAASGFVNGDTATSVISGTLTCSSLVVQTSPVKSYAITSCSGLTAPGYYNISYSYGSIEVDPAPLSITASSGTSNYGAMPPAVTPIYSGFVNHDNASSLTSTPVCVPALPSTSPNGSYTTSCSGASDGNYNITYQTGKIVIGTQALLVIASSASTTYGQATPQVTVSYSGFVNGQGPSSIKTPPTCTTTAKSSSGVGKYATLCLDAVDSDPNYKIVYVNGSIEVDQAPLTITASSATITYGATPPAVTASYSVFANGDSPSSLTTKPTCSTTATPSSPLGTYPTKCPGAVDPNYTIATVNGTLTIGPSTMLVLGSGAGAVTINGQSNLTVQGGLAVNSSSTGAVNVSGQSHLKATGTLISPSPSPITLSGQSSDSLAAVQTLAPELDPYAGLAAPNTSGLTVYSSSTINGPGVYTKAVVISAEAHVQLARGIYVFDNGLTISGEAKVTSAPGGVLLYFAGGGLNISGEAGATLSPLGSGTFPGVGVFESRSDTQAMVLTGESHTTLSAGVLYAPSAALNVSGQSGLSVGELIVRSVTLTGQSSATPG